MTVEESLEQIRYALNGQCPDSDYDDEREEISCPDEECPICGSIRLIKATLAAMAPKYRKFAIYVSEKAKSSLQEMTLFGKVMAIDSLAAISEIRGSNLSGAPVLEYEQFVAIEIDEF